MRAKKIVKGKTEHNGEATRKLIFWEHLQGEGKETPICNEAPTRFLRCLLLSQFPPHVMVHVRIADQLHRHDEVTKHAHQTRFYWEERSKTE